MNCCKLQQVGTKEHGKVQKLIQILEDGGRLKDKRGELLETKTEDCGMSSKRVRIHGPERSVERRQREKMLQDLGAIAQGRMRHGERAQGHEERFLSSWLREDLVGKEKRRDREEKVREEEGKSGKRESWREKRRKRLLLKEGMSNLFPVMHLRNSVPRMIRIVSGIPPLRWTCMVKLLLSGSNCKTVEPQSLFSPEKRQAFSVESQEDMNYDGTLEKAPPASRRKIMPPTTQPEPAAVS